MPEIKVIIATIWSRVRTELANTNDSVATGMEQEDGTLIAGPVANRLDLRFIKI